MKPIEFVTKATIRDYQILFFRFLPSQWKIYTPIYALVLPVIFLLSIFLKKYIILHILFGVFVVGVFVMRQFYLFTIYLKEEKYFFEEKKWIIDGNDVSIQGNANRRVVKIADLYKIAETRNYYLFYTSKYEYFIVRKKDVPLNQRNNLRDILKSYLK